MLQDERHDVSRDVNRRREDRVAAGTSKGSRTTATRHNLATHRQQDERGNAWFGQHAIVSHTSHAPLGGRMHRVKRPRWEWYRLDPGLAAVKSKRRCRFGAPRWWCAPATQQMRSKEVWQGADRALAPASRAQTRVKRETPNGVSRIPASTLTPTTAGTITALHVHLRPILPMPAPLPS